MLSSMDSLMGWGGRAETSEAPHDQRYSGIRCFAMTCLTAKIYAIVLGPILWQFGAKGILPELGIDARSSICCMELSVRLKVFRLFHGRMG